VASDHYRQHALDCLRMANRSTEANTRAILLDMAQVGIKLAEQAETIHRRPYLARVSGSMKRSRRRASRGAPGRCCP